MLPLQIQEQRLLTNFEHSIESQRWLERAARSLGAPKRAIILMAIDLLSERLDQKLYDDWLKTNPYHGAPKKPEFTFDLQGLTDEHALETTKENWNDV